MLFGSCHCWGIFVHLIYVDSDVSWSHYHVSVRTPNAVELHDDLNETTETLEFKDDALLVSFAFGHLVVVSQTHIFVHRENTKSGWASSVVAVELREKCPQFVQQADKYETPKLSSHHFHLFI